MSIYRGAGGAGDAVADSSSEALLIRDLVIEADADAAAAAASAAAAEVAQLAAEAAQTAAELAETNAETAETNAEAVLTDAGFIVVAADLQGTDTIGTVAASIADVNDVADNILDVTAVADNETNIDAVAANSTNINTVAGISSNVNTVAGISANVTTVATNDTNITTVATDIANVNAVGTNIANVNAVNANATNINTVAGNTADITTVAGISANVTTVATNNTNVTTVATNIANVNTVATDIADVSTVAGIAANVTTVAGIAANVTTVAGNSADITTVAGISSDVSTVAINVADINNFADVYQGAKATAPTVRNDTTALQEGDLYFNTVDDGMKVYNGTVWLDAYASLSGVLVASNNLSDLTNAATARSNLGVAIGTNVQAWDADLDTWATKTAPSGTVVGTSDSQTLTNKTLTTPVISSITNTGTLTLPTSTDTLVGRATTDTLTNKIIALGNNTVSGTLAEFNTAVTDADLVSIAGTETLTNKTLTSPVVTGGSINNTPIGSTTASTGAFSTLSATGVTTVQAGTVSAPAITTTGDTNTGIFFPAADAIAFTEGGVEAMRIDSSGNVLIGQTAANYNAEGIFFTKDGYITACADEATANTNTVLYLNRRSSDGSVINFYRDGGQVGFIGTTSVNTITFGTGATERMRINGSGNVVVGSTSFTANTRFEAVVDAADVSSILMRNSNANGVAGIQASTTSVNTYLRSDQTNLIGTIGTGTNHALTFVSNATERMRITSAGDVGIGTSSPSARLHPAAPTQTDNTKAALFVSDSATITKGVAIAYDGAANYGYIQTVNKGVAYTNLALNWEGGNVGIGTSSPSTKLHVAGGDLRLNDNFAINWGGTGSAIIGANNSLLRFDVNGSERMRIDSSGRILAGTTATFGGANSVFNAAADCAGAQCFAANNTNTGATSQYVIPVYRNGTLTGGITNTNTATGFATSSDYRLKENIAPMTGALGKVAELKPVIYKWKIDGSDGQGFIAHELQAVVPDCVSGEKDAVDKDGKPIYQGIDTSFLVATLTAAIQEQQALITSLTARIAALESK